MAHPFPTPDRRNPIIWPNGDVHPGTVFLKNAVQHPHFEVGDYTYASADVPPENWEQMLAPYLFPSAPERLSIGKFCQIAHGVQFITASANHRYDGFSSYPFAIFDGGITPDRPSLPGPGPSTVVGHDVWFGRGALILPGAQIGSGAIIGAGAVVSGDVPPFAVVVGNPGRVVRLRFDAAVTQRLMQIAWWHWPIDQILTHEAAICGQDLTALEAAVI
ncbi:MAG: CatB-related O-acetyltransferase [Pseudomonadota bacterium]